MNIESFVESFSFAGDLGAVSLSPSCRVLDKINDRLLLKARS
jgi:hypothetical protein